MYQHQTNSWLEGLPDGTPGLWLVALVTFGIGDLVTTGIGLSLTGIVEAGPVTGMLLQQYGFAGLIVLKALTFGGFFAAWWLLPRPYRVGVPVALVLVGVFAVTWNGIILAIVLL